MEVRLHCSVVTAFNKKENDHGAWPLEALCQQWRWVPQGTSTGVQDRIVLSTSDSNQWGRVRPHLSPHASACRHDIDAVVAQGPAARPEEPIKAVEARNGGERESAASPPFGVWPFRN